ncbi:hypothetical protein BV22DRAFT_870052 [Leucogyrophana mollusca]|uniref:Uncharacterized protein n=1 Tax=Leucogyrophana mollusca TaxID=85980 RepID=A0ACB8B0Q4_9AGAM|nr:hypothetical protein BV22DRAFT_870052 [Leucogyrophana mollusca]
MSGPRNAAASPVDTYGSPGASLEVTVPARTPTPKGTHTHGRPTRAGSAGVFPQIIEHGTHLRTNAPVTINYNSPRLHVSLNARATQLRQNGVNQLTLLCRRDIESMQSTSTLRTDTNVQWEWHRSLKMTLPAVFSVITRSLNAFSPSQDAPS